MRKLVWAALVPGLVIAAAASAHKPRVAATTSIVGDVVSAVAGDRVSLTVLIPRGTDPHSYEPRPRELAAMADADVVFINGAGLEASMDYLLKQPETAARICDLSSGLPLRRLASTELGGRHHAGDIDPHVWFDPHNVMQWARRIARELGKIDPEHAAAYDEAARAYIGDLEELDEWIHRRVAELPPQRRILVTDHAVLGYFAECYGFRAVGMVIPALATTASPSAADLARLEDTLRRLKVPAIFVGTTVNPQIASRVAHDSGARVVEIYTGSLSSPGGPAGTYIDLMRYDVGVIVDALRGGSGGR